MAESKARNINKSFSPTGGIEATAVVTAAGAPAMPAGNVLDSAGVISLAAHVEAGVFRVNPQSISVNHTIDSADNAMSAGPISIDSSASGATITINGNWSVV